MSAEAGEPSPNRDHFARVRARTANECLLNRGPDRPSCRYGGRCQRMSFRAHGRIETAPRWQYSRS
jgi:hypothetical protein